MKFSLFKLLLVITIFAIIFQWFRLQRERTELREHGDQLARKMAYVIPASTLKEPYRRDLEERIAEFKLLDEIAMAMSCENFRREFSKIEVPAADDHSSVDLGEYFCHLTSQLRCREYAHFVMHIPKTRQLGLVVESEKSGAVKQLWRVKLDSGTSTLSIRSGWDRNPQNTKQLSIYFDVSINEQSLKRVSTEFMDQSYVVSPFHEERLIQYRTELIEKRKRKLNPADHQTPDVELNFERFPPGKTLPKLSEHVTTSGFRVEEQSMAVRLRLVDFEME